MSKKTKSTFLLLLTALIWGNAFAAQSAGMDYIGPWTFNCVRSLIGGLTLLVLLPFLDRFRYGKKYVMKTDQTRHLFKAGILCGAFLCAASMFQQKGIQYTTAGKAGFLTALYVIFVPLLNLAAGRKTTARIWFAALIAVAGFYFLSLAENMMPSKGDVLLVICALLFAAHIIVIDRTAGSTDGVRLSCIQFFTAGLLSFFPMLILETPSLQEILSAAVPVLYAGILSSGVGYTLQIIGQKDADPVTAGLILSLESVFSVFAGYVFLHQMLSIRELVGCVLVFAAVTAAQLPEKKKDGIRDSETSL